MNYAIQLYLSLGTGGTTQAIPRIERRVGQAATLSGWNHVWTPNEEFRISLDPAEGTSYDEF
jgi:hypothetical protein